MKAIRKKLNSEVDIVRVENGAYTVIFSGIHYKKIQLTCTIGRVLIPVFATSLE